ncbi:hypothetical protein BKA63DRAFT_599618 [Paraphoma chrysanthemicola]|nr:hypothetical protein BKA63DRAFT_599618 [Paraphoma chrysanthemicola]
MPVHLLPQEEVATRAPYPPPIPFKFDLEDFPPLHLNPLAHEVDLRWSSKFPETTATINHESTLPDKFGPTKNLGTIWSTTEYDALSTSSPITPFVGFMKVPAEREVARYFVDPVEIREFRRASNNISRQNFLPPLCRISGVLKDEIIGVYLRNSMFMVAAFEDNRFLDGFLQTVKKGYESVRSIHFAFFDCFRADFPENADLELAVRCTGIRTIRITFHTSRLTIWVLEGDYDLDGLTGYPRPVDEIWSHYRLARLLDCKMLKEVIIERKGRRPDHAIQAADNLGCRIKQEYEAKHHRTLEVAYAWA